jgi:ketosteroid isomerase-like protein
MVGDGRNLDAVKRFLEAARDSIGGESGPFEEALEELCASDIVMVPSSALASGDVGPFRGREGVLEYQEAVGRRWGEFRIDVEEYVDVPPNTVVVLGKVAARRDDGSGYATELGLVNHLRDGKIVAIHSYQSKRRALEEAGGAELVARVASE